MNIKTSRQNKRAKGDVQLNLKNIPVEYLRGASTVAIAEGNNAGWDCQCGQALIGRCYFQFGHQCHTVCPSCSSVYRVMGDEKKRAVLVRQVSSAVDKHRAA